MSCYPWRYSPETEHQNQCKDKDTRSTRNHTWLHRFLQSSLKSLPRDHFPQPLEIPQTSCAPKPTAITTSTTTTTSKNVTTDGPSALSPLLLLPAELRQKILKYTITDTEIQNTLLYESVQTKSSTWEARVYYFDGSEFAWDSEATIFSRAPFQESQVLSSVHPLLTEDMEYVKKQWVKRVRAIGEEKRREVLREMEGGDGAFVCRGFEETSRFPKADVRKRIDSLMIAVR
ncbi:hypothetical protein EG327_005137 [Venturia inaequalis]|uniref:Uncharacterized protein n=1 Tax=Venturia inaequalis TaxID=5025 RepID=A0A8H3ZK17_VENIN|nr:hypothetical protein EG327_005137 [Venturia inaequalis]